MFAEVIQKLKMFEKVDPSVFIHSPFVSSSVDRLEKDSVRVLVQKNKINNK